MARLNYTAEFIPLFVGLEFYAVYAKSTSAQASSDVLANAHQCVHLAHLAAEMDKRYRVRTLECLTAHTSVF